MSRQCTPGPTACPVGLCTDSNEAMVRRNRQALAEEAVEFITDLAAYAKNNRSRKGR